MKTFLRTVAAILAGTFVLFALVVAVELFSAVVHPLPEGSVATKEDICRHVERYPAWVLAVVVPAWAAAAFAGTWTARRIGNLCAAAVVGLLLLAAVACNISMLPYPTWFKVATLIAIPIAVLAGSRQPMSPAVTAIDDRV